MSKLIDGTLVEYFFVGVGKCGTSWLYRFISKYNLLSVPSIKEPYLIDKPRVRHVRIVDKLYKMHHKMADFSNSYYWDGKNADKINAYNQNAKIIITLRKPSDRIQSHFLFLQRSGLHTNQTLKEYLEGGDALFIVDRSNYWGMIDRYVSRFGRENVLILPLELLRDDPEKYIIRLCNFIDVAVVYPSPEDLRPVRPKSRARINILAKFARHGTSFLRKFELLGVLGKIKQSPLINSVLYVEDRNKRKLDFGSLDEFIAGLDDEYLKRLGELID